MWEVWGKLAAFTIIIVIADVSKAKVSFHAVSDALFVT